MSASVNNVDSESDFAVIRLYYFFPASETAFCEIWRELSRKYGSVESDDSAAKLIDLGKAWREERKRNSEQQESIGAELVQLTPWETLEVVSRALKKGQQDKAKQR